MVPEMVNGGKLIEWILANMNHTRQVYALVEHIEDEIRHQQDYENMMASVYNRYIDGRKEENE